jgi:hypothetical protein
MFTFGLLIFWREAMGDMGRRSGVMGLEIMGRFTILIFLVDVLKGY